MVRPQSGGAENEAYIEGNDVDFYLAGAFGFELFGGNQDATPTYLFRSVNRDLRIMRGTDTKLSDLGISVNTGLTGTPNGTGLLIGAPAKTVTLPGEFNAGLETIAPLTYTVMTASQSGGYTKVVTDDGSTINGASGATGFKIYGDNKAVVLRYDPYFSDWSYNPSDLMLRGIKNSGGGVASGSVWTFSLSGFDATTSEIVVLSTGGGENVAADAWLTKAIVTNRTSTGCDVEVKNLGASSQTLAADYIVIPE